MKLASFLPLIGLVATVPAQGSTPEYRPNVVVLLADDAAWGDFSFNGNTNLATPRIDGLAEAGTVFKNFYVCPVCAPTRAEFLTGRYYLRTGLRGLNGGEERIDLDERTIAEVFRAAGYTTGAFGKWHNGTQWPYHPNARGFDEFYGFTTGHSGHYFDAPLDHNGRPVRGQGYIADDLTDHALRFIAENRDRPFFCYVPFNTPHAPLCVPDEYWDRFKDRDLTLRAGSTYAEDINFTRAALAMCENLDWNVGRILDQLDALGITEDTIVVFFSDNGPATFRWNGGMKGKKATLDEGGVRAPFAIRWPGRISPGTTIDHIAAGIDLLPTLARLAGIPVADTKPLDGRDLTPLLFGTVKNWPERRIFSHTNWNNRISVRDQHHRLDGFGALFDLDADPGQQTDIAADKPAAAAALAQAVEAWREEMSVAGRMRTDLPDNRPLSVGYNDCPYTPLPASDGIAHGGIQRSAKAPNSAYFTHWTSLDDSITWEVEIHQSGDYAVVLEYTCAPSDIGAEIELSFDGTTLTGTVTTAWDPPLIKDEDRAPRMTESYLKPFRPLMLGTIHLDPGRGPLALRATRIPGSAVIDLSGISLRLIK